MAYLWFPKVKNRTEHKVVHFFFSLEEGHQFPTFYGIFSTFAACFSVRLISTYDICALSILQKRVQN